MLEFDFDFSKQQFHKVIEQVGQCIAESRKKRSWSQTYLAKRVGIEAVVLDKIEKGESKANLNILIKIAHELNIDPKWLARHDYYAFLYEHAEAEFSQEFDQQNLDWQALPLPSSSQQLLESMQFWLEPYVSSHQTEISANELAIAEDIEATKRMAIDLAAWSINYGSGPGRLVAVLLLSNVCQSLRALLLSQTSEDLFIAMAQLAHTVAVMSWHSGFQAKTQTYFRLALHASHAAKNRALGVQALLGMAHQLLFLQHSQTAVALLELAKQGLEQDVTDDVDVISYSCLHTWQAWALAMQGDELGFKHHFALAKQFMNKVDNNEQASWPNFYSKDRLSYILAIGLDQLAKLKPDQYLEQAYQQHLTALQQRADRACYLTVLDNIALAEIRCSLKDYEATARYQKVALHTASALPGFSYEVNSRFFDLYKLSKQQTKQAQLEAVNQQLQQYLLGSNLHESFH